MKVFCTAELQAISLGVVNSRLLSILTDSTKWPFKQRNQSCL